MRGVAGTTSSPGTVCEELFCGAGTPLFGGGEVAAEGVAAAGTAPGLVCEPVPGFATGFPATGASALDHVTMCRRPSLDVLLSRATRITMATTTATNAKTIRARGCLTHCINLAPPSTLKSQRLQWTRRGAFKKPTGADAQAVMPRGQTRGVHGE